MNPRLAGLVGALGLMTLGLTLLASALVVGTLGGNAPIRSAGSTWSEGPAGASRLYRLLVEAGRDVHRHEGELQTLPGTGMLVVLNPPGGLRPHEEATLLDRVERGATLVLATEVIPPALAGLGIEARRFPLAGVAKPLVPSIAARAGPGLIGAGDTLLVPEPGLAPLFSTEEGVLLGGLAVGDGRILLLSDPGQLSNAGLNDPLQVRLAGTLFGDETGPITFVEGLHGYTAARGLLPWLWRAGWGPMVILALLAALIAGWRAAAQAPVPGTADPGHAGGLSRLAHAVGRMRQERGLWRRSLEQVLQEALRRRIPEDHPAVQAAHQARRDPDLTPEAALTAAVDLEQTWR